MTAVTGGQRVRVTTGFYTGRVGTVNGQTVGSKRWRIRLDGVDSFGRQHFGVFKPAELEAVDERPLRDVLFERWVAGDITFDEYMDALPVNTSAKKYHELTPIWWLPIAARREAVNGVTANEDEAARAA